MTEVMNRIHVTREHEPADNQRCGKSLGRITQIQNGGYRSKVISNIFFANTRTTAFYSNSVLLEKKCWLIMAFQPQGVQESQNRRNILQDLQQKRQMLLNQGQGAVGNVGPNLSAMRAAGPEASTSVSNIKPHEATVIRNPADTLSQRQALEHANATSSGYFISQDSAYGNLILPVLPRFENGELKTS